jgi:hypothetical protein
MGCSFGTGIVGYAGMRSWGVGTRCYGSSSGGPAIAAVVHRSCVAGVHHPSAAGTCMARCISAATRIPSSTSIAEAMAAPAVVIAPAGPRAHAQEDTVIEITRSIEPIGRAGIGCIVVVAIGTDGLLPYANHYLSLD